MAAEVGGRQLKVEPNIGVYLFRFWFIYRERFVRRTTVFIIHDRSVILMDFIIKTTKIKSRFSGRIFYGTDNDHPRSIRRRFNNPVSEWS